LGALLKVELEVKWMQEYRYTHVGIVTILMILIAASFTAFMFDSGLKTAEGQDAIILKVTGLVVAGVFVLALASFYSFTIQIADGKLTFWFGLGLGKKSFSIEGIRSVGTVKNPWYYFWGIKSIPGGWLYSIAPGGRAIELIFKDSRKIRLGTNRSEEIKKRLDEAIGTST
jgi:hypothetical protein